MAPVMEFECPCTTVSIRNTFFHACSSDEEELECEQPGLSRSKTEPSARRAASVASIEAVAADPPTALAASAAAPALGDERPAPKRASFSAVVEEACFMEEVDESDDDEDRLPLPDRRVSRCVTRDSFESPTVWGNVGEAVTFGNYGPSSQASNEAPGIGSAPLDADALAQQQQQQQQDLGVRSGTPLVDAAAVDAASAIPRTEPSTSVWQQWDRINTGAVSVPVLLVSSMAFPASPLGMLPFLPPSPNAVTTTMAAVADAGSVCSSTEVECQSQNGRCAPEEILVEATHSTSTTASLDTSAVPTRQPAAPQAKDSHRPVPASTKVASVGSKRPVSGEVPPGQRTTVMLRNLPNNYTRTNLLEMIDSEGFMGRYDFLYFPIDFRTHAALGYAFLNLATPQDAEEFRRRINGFSRWNLPSSKVCSVAWSHPHQGLESHIARYRNSPLMHESVPDSYRPILFSNGVRVPFPEPTKKIKPPRHGTERMLV